MQLPKKISPCVGDPNRARWQIFSHPFADLNDIISLKHLSLQYSQIQSLIYHVWYIIGKVLLTSIQWCYVCMNRGRSDWDMDKTTWEGYVSKCLIVICTICRYDEAMKTMQDIRRHIILVFYKFSQALLKSIQRYRHIVAPFFVLWPCVLQIIHCNRYSSSNTSFSSSNSVVFNYMVFTDSYRSNFMKIGTWDLNLCLKYQSDILQKRSEICVLHSIPKYSV